MYVASPPDFAELFRKIPPARLFEVLRPGTKEMIGYVPWDKVRQLKPPEGLNHEEWWLRIKMGRQAQARVLPLADAQGEPFSYAVPDEVFRLLHFVDQRCSGEIAMAEVVTADGQARQHYLVNSLMEEAIRSSQLEGATTSRQAAKELLRSGRPPKDRSERMIVNNYLALQYMRDGIGEHLTPQAVLELQRILTDGTLDNPDAAGRLQRPDEERVSVVDGTTGEVLHVPPPAEQLPVRLARLCDFANERESAEGFLHPVIRGLILHFWLAYDHPFEDGNGRTARALFYWYMRTRGYWLIEYLSISRILRKAPAKYARSYLYTETDDRDTTYFVLYQLQVIQRAVEELHVYLKRKMQEVRAVERLLKRADVFNHRQLALLGNAIRDPEQMYTMQSHAGSHNVTHETARTDLRDLADRGLLECRRAGRRYVFVSPPDLTERLRAAA